MQKILNFIDQFVKVNLRTFTKVRAVKGNLNYKNLVYAIKSKVYFKM